MTSDHFKRVSEGAVIDLWMTAELDSYGALVVAMANILANSMKRVAAMS